MALAALGLYAAVVLALHAGGNAYQLTPAGYGANLVNNLIVNLSPRGLLLSWAPSALLLAMALAGMHGAAHGMFRARDAWLVPALILVALVLTQDFQVGRIVMMAAPIFAIPAAARFAQLMERPAV